MKKEISDIQKRQSLDTGATLVSKGKPQTDIEKADATKKIVNLLLDAMKGDSNE